MKKTVFLVVLLFALGLTAQAAWSQQTVATMKVYVADSSYVQFYREHEGYAHSRTGHDGQQTDYFAKGKFDSVCRIDGSRIRANRCGNIVDTIECVVNVTLNIPPCPAPIPGATGPTGPQGLQGTPGGIGATGGPGPVGSKGDRGPRGFPGQNGVNGIDGRDGYMLVQQIARYGQSGPPFRGYQTYQSVAFVQPARNGWIDAVPQVLGGWLSAGAIRPSNIQISNGSSSVSNGGSSYATATQTQGQGQNQGQQQGQDQTTDNTNVLTGGDQTVTSTVDTNIGIVNGQSQAQ